MIVGRLATDPAISGPFGYDSSTVPKGEIGIKLKEEKG
jgi:hypothetical protein